MRSADLRAWTEKLRLAQRAGDLPAVAEALEALCQAEPSDPRRWKALARTCRELGRPLEAVAALVRAAELHAQQGDGLAAVAACRWILELDPTHTATLERLARLQEAAGMPEPGVARRVGRRPEAHPRPAPIEEVLLHDVVEPALPPSPDGEREIPLEPSAPRPRRDDAAARRTARGLVATPLFGRLGARALRQLIEATRRVELAEGEVLFRQGDPADALYVVVEGAVVPIAEDGQRHRLSVLEPGDFFGEIALITNAPRNATIEALVPSELLAIDRSAIADLLEAEPEVLAVVLRFLRERLVARLLGTSPVFRGIGREEATQLLRGFRLTEVRAGTTLIEQGRPSRALFLVLAGELRVIEERPGGEKEIATLPAGAPCGEMSLLDGGPAVARVDAARKSWLLVLPRAEFEGVVRSHPLLGRSLSTIAERRRGSR